MPPFSSGELGDVAVGGTGRATARPTSTMLPILHAFGGLALHLDVMDPAVQAVDHEVNPVGHLVGRQSFADHFADGRRLVVRTGWMT